MQLKELEVSGFKSFAKKTSLSFTRPITGIVGPNGSGKSNVAEAFRFALGEQSIKSLRGKRGEDLIFSGTNQAPRSNRASVKVVFDNSNRLFDMEFPEVSIERTVYRDGINEYSINGSKVRLKDVQELLAHANIGQSGHHIISQGEADRILSASPRDRRIMLEEALGLRVFKYKKEEAVKKLEKTEENIAHVGSLRREIAPHLRFLKKQVEKVARAKEARDELIAQYQIYFAEEEAWLLAEEGRISSARKDPEARLAAIQEEKAGLGEVEKVEVDRSEVDQLRSKLRGVRDEETERLKDVARAEGVLAAAQTDERRGETVTISHDEFSQFKDSISHVEERAESASTFTELRGVLDQFFGVVRPFIKQFSARSVDRKHVEELEKAHAEAVALYEKVVAERKALEEQVREVEEALRSEEMAGHKSETRRLELAAEEAQVRAELTRLEDAGRRALLIREEFEREHREAIALVGGQGVQYKKKDAPEETERSVQDARKRDIERLKIRVEELGGGGEEVLKEYEEAVKRDEHLEKELADLASSKESLLTLIADLDKELTTTFNDGLAAINDAFNEFFTTMFGGGSARLVTVSLNVKEEDSTEDLDRETDDSSDAVGIEVAVTVPGKRVKGLVALSGGERALTSIALIFAMSQVNPPPFLILDETDAALDEANSKRYGDMIENLAKRSQLILITHNRETMSRAGVLYGVTMQGDGISKLLSIQFDEALAVAK